jgi:RHS repeat-associated protein
VDSVDVAKAAGIQLVPAHKMATEYRYNTLNLAIAQRAPDAGISRFWYDKLGRLAVSQNAKQLTSNSYSYTAYDDQGRTTEVGELSSSTGMTDLISQHDQSLSSWFNSVSGSRREITRTTYDLAYPFFDAEEFAGRNLRNRISWTALYRNADSVTSGGHSVASFYSYDIHGGIDTLLQDYKEGKMAKVGHRFKRMAYNYDLVSNKVNEVAYQPGAADAFYHRYTYDADNRITNVLTSRDGIYWEKDAYYQYYKHGPLARSVLGQQQVQGIDYAYTLQGWLKGINSTTLTAGDDQGNDGNINGVIPKDVFGFALHYYGNNDYKPINQNQKPFAAVAGEFGPLYNGNIGAISQHLSGLGNPLLYNYKYDAMNRMREMQVYRGLNTATNTWNPVSLDDFKESVKYDGNGNILTYNRNGNNSLAGKPLAMDSLSYAYRPGTNKLDFIRDGVLESNYSDDIDNQLSGNYDYDSIGNLVKDAASGISKINWTVYGRISDIEKTDGSKIYYTYDVSGNRISKSVGDTLTWYVRDAKGNVMSTYTTYGKSIILSETHLYTTDRIGIIRFDRDVTTPDTEGRMLPGLGLGMYSKFVRAQKTFELTNHLGNVLGTVSDRKLFDAVDGGISRRADVLSVNEYYPFGMHMPGRGLNSSSYKYGFNGKENDNDLNGDGNLQDYGMRMYDPRVGKFLSIDPLAEQYPFYSPYQFASNNPIAAIDLDGLEAVVVVTGKTMELRSNKRGPYFMYQVNIYENMTLDQYNEANKTGKLGPPTATALLARDGWQKPGRDDRSSARYGSLNETPPGTYYLEYSKAGYGKKLHNLKISDAKNGDVINGPDGERSGVRIHEWSPHDAVGCLTTGSNDKNLVNQFIADVPSLKEKGEEVRLIIEPREAVYDAEKEIWKGVKSDGVIPKVQAKPAKITTTGRKPVYTDNTYAKPSGRPAKIVGNATKAPMKLEGLSL